MITEPKDAVQSQAAEVVPVVSPYAETRLTTGQQFAISAYWLATNFLWGAMLVIMLPAEAKHLAPPFRVTALALLTGISAFIALIVPLVAGALSDRCAHSLGRRRPFIIAGVVVNVVGLFLMDLAFKSAQPLTGSPSQSIWTIERTLLTNSGFLAFLLAYMVVQFGNNIASAAYSGVIPDLVPEDQRGAASGFMALMTQAGTLLGVISVGMLLGHQTETVKYLLISTVLAGVALITILGIKETPLPKKPPPIRWGPYVKSLWIDPRKYPDFAWVWITRALVMLGFYGVLPYINYYLTDVIGMEKPDAPASILTAIVLVASAASGIYAGYVSDRIGRKRVVYIANSVIAAMALAFVLCRSYNEVLLAGVLYGLGFGAYTSVDWALGTDVLPSRVDAAKEMAVWHIAMTLPQSIAAPIAGTLIALGGMNTLVVGGERVYHYHLAGYAALFVFAAACFAGGAYFLRNVRGVR